MVDYKGQSFQFDLTGKRVNAGDTLTIKFGPNVIANAPGLKNSDVVLQDGTVIGRVTGVSFTDNHSSPEARKKLQDSPNWATLDTTDLSAESKWVITFNEEAAKKDNLQFMIQLKQLGFTRVLSGKESVVNYQVMTNSGKKLYEKRITVGPKQKSGSMNGAISIRDGLIENNDWSDWVVSNSKQAVPNRRIQVGDRIRASFDGKGVYSLQKSQLEELKTRIGELVIRKDLAMTGFQTEFDNPGKLYKAVQVDSAFKLVSVDPETNTVVWEVVKLNNPELDQALFVGRTLFAGTKNNHPKLVSADGVTPLDSNDVELYKDDTLTRFKEPAFSIEVLSADDGYKTPIKELTDRVTMSINSRGVRTSGSGETAKQTVTVRFVDSKTGQELKTPKLYKPFRNDPFTVPEGVLLIEGKTLVNPNDAIIDRVNEDKVITLRYEDSLQNSNVSVQVVDETGKTIRPTKTVFTEAKPEGTQYSVRKPRIAGYRFVRAEGELAGTLGKTDKTVKLVYKADSSVVAGTDPDTIEERKERAVPIPFETETRDNPELWQGEERVINSGAEGSKTVVTTRQLDENQQPVGDPVVTENVTKEPVKRVVERGTKNPAGTETVTTEKTKPFKTETRDNPDLYEGDERIVTEGKDGVTTVTTVYKTNKGKRTGDNPTVTETEKQPLVNRVVERGTKDPNGIDLVKEHEDVVYKTEYRDNPELYEGETRVIQEGELGSNVITKQYKTKKGKRTDEEPIVTKTTEKEPKNRIIERGTKPVAGVDTVVEDKEVPFKLVVKDNPELTEGEERVVTEGTPGLVKKTTAYKTEKGKRVGDPTVTETVVKEPIDRVVEKGTKPKTPKQTDADKNNPKGKDQTVFVGEKPDPKNSVENYNDLPEGTVVKWEITPDTATPGQKPSVLLFEYPDGSIERVSVIVIAIPKPEPKDQTVFVGENPKAEDSIGNYPQLPEGTLVSWLVPPKTDKPGVVDGVVLIEYPDGRRVEVPVKVTVVEKEKEKQPPQQEPNNNKDKVSEKSDNSDNSDKDSKKDKPTPQGKDQTVRVGENPLVQDSIANHKDLPKGAKLSWEKNPNTTKPGVIAVVVLVEYPDGTSEKVTVRITVVDDSDKGKEKDNHENDNNTNPDTNKNTDADNNQTTDKKELNQNKQPDRKESIKTGVGSVDQTAAGVVLTATALALSAFALRRRKQQ